MFHLAEYEPMMYVHCAWNARPFYAYKVPFKVQLKLRCLFILLFWIIMKNNVKS